MVSTAVPAPSHGQAIQIRECLHSVLESAPFRGTRQCQALLSWMVERTLGGETDQLKERVIGTEVFGRAHDYDPSVDPVVRLRAAEVRKRLAQYFQNHPESPVRIDIPSGSYKAVFQWSTSPAALPAIHEPRRSRHWGWIAIAVSLLAVLLAVTFAVVRRSRSGTPGALDQFWAPALASPKPILIYNSTSTVLMPVDPTLDPADETREMVTVRGQFTCVGDAYASVVLSSLLTLRGKLFQMRYGTDLSFSDLRYQPSILIGAFNNTWTLQTTNDLRFVFEKHPTIRDRQENKLYTLPSLKPDGRTPEDYAIVSRVFDSRTGQLLIAAGGITQYGTRAAGEFLTSPESMSALVRSAPAEWPKKNLQVLLHTQIVGETPGPPRIVAAYVW